MDRIWASTWGVLGLCWGMHRLGATWVLYRHSMTEGAHRLHPEDSLRCKWRASWRAWWRCWWGQRAWTSWRMRSRQSRRILTKTLLLTKPCVVFNNKIVVCWGNLESTVGAKLTVLWVLGHYHIRGGQRLYFPPSLRGRPSTPFGVQWGIFADNQMRIWMGSDDLI